MNADENTKDERKQDKQPLSQVEWQESEMESPQQPPPAPALSDTAPALSAAVTGEAETPSEHFLPPQSRAALNRLDEAAAHKPFAPDSKPAAETVSGRAYEAAKENDAAVERRMRQISRRSFLWGAAALVGGYTAWRGLIKQPQVDGIIWPFRLSLEANERLARDYFKSNRLAPTFSRAQAETPKENGFYGLSDNFDPAEWKLTVAGLEAKDEEHASRTFTLADIKKLPRVEMVTQLKCIEGWSVIVQWAGARFADFVAKYPPAKIDDQMPQYVGMMTPNEEYFVGLDMESALHPQTLLCYEMNGEPLTLEHGAPLRLVIPVKYGIKNIKRIGSIHFSNDRPKDYWAKEGYDWYAGH